MQTCPFNTDCDLVVAEGELFQQSAPRQFFREVYCRTHDKTYNETLRVAGYFAVDEDGHEGEFLSVLPGEVPAVREVP